MTNVIMGMQFLERVCFRISRAEVCSILLTLGVLRIPVPVHSRSYGRGKKKKKLFFFLGRMQNAGHTDQTETSE